MVPFNPYNRLKQPLPAQPEQFNPAAGAPQLQWQPNPDEAQGDNLGGNVGSVANSLNSYLKKRRAQTSPTLSDSDLGSMLGGGL